jgi:ATP-dependent helicase HrpA
MVAQIDPAWIEPLAGSLAQRSYSEPVWSSRQARAVCVERFTLLGLPIVTDRRIAYDRIDSAESRRLFILHALVRGEWTHRHAELDTVATALDDMRERLSRARLSEDRIDEDGLVAFFSSRIPEAITSGRAFDAWWRRERREQPGLFALPDDLAEALPVEEDFPGEWGSTGLQLTYRFAPGDPRDGVTVHGHVRESGVARPQRGSATSDRQGAQTNAGEKRLARRRHEDDLQCGEAGGDPVHDVPKG